MIPLSSRRSGRCRTNSSKPRILTSLKKRKKKKEIKIKIPEQKNSPNKAKRKRSAEKIQKLAPGLREIFTLSKKKKQKSNKKERRELHMFSLKSPNFR
jgi:hypothetical protein